MVIFSGIQPTGRKHLGNYIGAILNYVKGQDKADPAIYCIVDLHGTTVQYDPEELRRRTRETAALLIAAGLEPERCILFRQGDVQEHAELCWLLSSVTSVGQLNRMHQFRDKAGAARDRVSAGLLFYPVLMAADVLAYRAHEVPVGEDQREHIELMRDVAEAFNKRFGETLVVPEGNIPTVGARVRDLKEPERKMSTTGGTPQGTVFVDEEPESIVKKFKKAVADSGSEIVVAEDKPGISNMIEILAVARGVTPADIERDFAGSGYGAFKTAVGEEVAAWLAPTRERFLEIKDDTSEIERFLELGAEKARAIAAPVVADVREAMGVGPVRTPA
ncbi:tryptophan--tRNA ligase [Solirubrobacter sp. CPCC 204708]|uniref:Tryptophan--tRNA ligase n=1 Tax=Solirubrobacter deserti TaxID=2282478 RepID=A0ABT4RR53_9ACTN|nr:tryptophan--tRNA ligase [Solirubrobacter deserti]MBE2314712.1 tryptophan--tRNA ligase [Solirubrobacter deserti]MDA0141029.1 tryptophan--tRNA ligase [Solirubrobacter deserti]